MNAARLHEYHQALKLDSVDEPKATGPFDVVVKIGAAGLCRTDLHIQEGQWAEKSEVVLPYIPGHENAGWVHEVGSGVSNVEVGDTVIVHPFISCGLCTPCRPRRRHALRQRLVPRHQPRRRLRRAAAHERALGRQARPVARARLDRRAGRRRADRDPRRQEGDPRARGRHQDRRDRRRRARAHRHPVPEGLHADRDHRRRPEREGARAGEGARRRPHDQGRGLEPHRHRAGAHRRHGRRGDHRLRRREGRGRGRRRDDPGRRLLLRHRLRPEHRHPDDRRHLARDLLHREPRRDLRRPAGPDDADRAGQGHAAHDHLSARSHQRRDGRPRQRTAARARHPHPRRRQDGELSAGNVGRPA